MATYLAIADGEVGYRGDGSNHVKYWLDLAPSMNGQPWCGTFISWCLWKAGQLGAIGGSPMYSCTAMMNKAKSRGQWANSPVPGCLVIYDFQSGSPAHVEFVLSSTATTLDCIGGNTSGDLVAHKIRRQVDALGYWHITAPVGAIPTGSVGSGPGFLGVGEYLPAPTPTVVGEQVADPSVRFGSGRVLRV